MHRIKGLQIKGVVTNDVVGRPVEIKLFYKSNERESFSDFPQNISVPSRSRNFGELSTIYLTRSFIARYVILGLVSYTSEPCVKLELLGCEYTKEPVILGYEHAAPVCVDKEPPRFLNCPEHPIQVSKDRSIMLPVNFEVPTAIDNSGRVVRTEIRPANFKPPQYIFKDTVVQYLAYDSDGNFAVCTVNITVPDYQKPTLECPQSYVVELLEQQDNYEVNFTETLSRIKSYDDSGYVTINIQPEFAIIPLGTFRNVTVTATDKSQNEAICHFQVSVQPVGCSNWTLEAPANGKMNCDSKGGDLDDKSGYVCVAVCDKGFRFTDGSSNKIYECNGRGKDYLPNTVVPDCVPEDTREAAYDVVSFIF